MNTEYIREPKDGLIRYGSEVVENIRKEYNMNKKDDLEQTIAIIEEWIKQQEHFVKKEFSKAYIEKCVISSKGSIEKAKQQIDRMCTMRTLMPKYFQTVDLSKSEIMSLFDIVNIALMPKQTHDYYRVLIVKAKPNSSIRSSNDYTLFFKLFAFLAEYLQVNDYSRGYIFVGDYCDVNIRDIICSLNVVELRQFLPIITKGYRTRIKGIYLITSSKLIEVFISMVKPLFSAKIGDRIHAITNKSMLGDLIDSDTVPVEYGGIEKPIEELHEDLIKSLSSPSIQELMKNMNGASTDESKRRTDIFNDQYMGVSGTFRTLSLD